MSVVQEERNTLKKRFGRQAVILVDDSLYSAASLKPNVQNNRLFDAHTEAVTRLNFTMQRHIDGNAQIFYTMLFKDQPREKLILNWWNSLIKQQEFQDLPEELKRLEWEQTKKLGPTSRFTIDKLFDAFVTHVDTQNKTLNKHFNEYELYLQGFIKLVVEDCKLALAKDPSLMKHIDGFYSLKVAYDNLNKDKSGGDPYFIGVDKNIAGANANDLYLSGSSKIQKDTKRAVYYEQFIRVQNKGNTFIPEYEDALKGVSEGVIESSHELWLPEKNRVVQGDSRSMQFLFKNISDIITKLPKVVDPNFGGWLDDEERDVYIRNSMKEFSGRYQFDNFDATEYDATTDPKNFELGIHGLYEVCRGLGLHPDDLYPEDDAIRHYIQDPTLTPWGAYKRASTPSGHSFTGPNGTFTNLLRCYVQTARLMKFTPEQTDIFNSIIRDYANKGIALFMAVGDDAWQLRDLEVSAKDIAATNDSDGFTSNEAKILLSKVLIHFLQRANYYNPTSDLLITNYYPASRVLEHSLFQEKANQYDSLEVSTQAVVQNLGNCKHNPLNKFLTKFLIVGDPKYRLGSIMGVRNLFKAAAKGRTVAEFLGREWDPSYQSMTWDQYHSKMSEVYDLVESVGREMYPDEMRH